MVSVSIHPSCSLLSDEGEPAEPIFVPADQVFVGLMTARGNAGGL